MARSALALLLLLGHLSPSFAAYAPRKVGVSDPTARKATGDLRRSTPQDEFSITRQTEVFLDGRRCKYEEIPEGASVTFMEVAAGPTKEVLRVHFRSSKVGKAAPARR